MFSQHVLSVNEIGIMRARRYGERDLFEVLCYAVERALRRSSYNIPVL